MNNTNIINNVIEQQLAQQIKRIDDIVQLQDILIHCVDTINTFQKKIDKLEEAAAQRAQLRLDLDDKLTILRKLIFGRGREKVKSDDNTGVGDRPRDDGKFLLHTQSLVPPPSEKKIENLPEEVIIHEANEADLIEEARLRGLQNVIPTDWREIPGLFEESTEVTVIERVYKKIRHKRKKYRLNPEKNGSDKDIIVAASGPDKLLPGCSYSLDFAASVVADKYLMHLPLERQRRKMEASGLKGVSVKTLYNLCWATSVHLEKVAEGIRQDIFSAGLAISCDETPWPIVGDKDSNGYMWALANQAGSYYRFEPTRSGKIIEEMLQGYAGPVLNDGFSGYNRLKVIQTIIAANCWAHSRRKFFDIKENYPADCEEILKLIDKLFAVERRAKDWDELGQLRRTDSKVLIDQIYKWLIEKKTSHPFKESSFMKAVDYSLKFWGGLTKFLTNVKIPLSTNEVERALRHSVMGRKNFNGSKSINGADVAAVIYTVVESCKKAELDPISYIKYVIKMNSSGQSPLTPLNYARATRPVA